MVVVESFKFFNNLFIQLIRHIVKGISSTESAGITLINTTFNENEAMQNGGGNNLTTLNFFDIIIFNRGQY